MNYLKHVGTGQFTTGWDTDEKPVYIFTWNESVLVIDGEDARTIAGILDVTKLKSV